MKPYIQENYQRALKLKDNTIDKEIQKRINEIDFNERKRLEALALKSKRREIK